jgi:hypothetical protein
MLVTAEDGGEPSGDGEQELRPAGSCRAPVECLDSTRLLDPPGEEFHLPRDRYTSTEVKAGSVGSVVRKVSGVLSGRFGNASGEASQGSRHPGADQNVTFFRTVVPSRSLSSLPEAYG